MLFAITALAYLPVRQFDFVNFDDPDYVVNNLHVLKGLTLDSIVWALTSFDAANWFPLTRLSELVDVQFLGVQPGSHHEMNVLYHAIAVVCLFAFLFRGTKSLWPAAWVALMFGIHPLHIESVAWVSERKDVLCALFFFLTLYLYVRYAAQPSVGRYVSTIVAFALALLSKPMAVTLPVVLVLLDYWPLRRPWKEYWLEKLPFAALAAVAGGITLWSQQAAGAVRTFSTFPLELRIENAIVSYVFYALQFLWPANLAVFYPYPTGIPAWQWILSLALLLAVSVAVFRYRTQQPYLLAGWTWYLVTLLPVIGLVQVGAQARADRYTYFTTTGLCIAAAWAAAHLIRERPRARMPVAIAAVGLILGAVISTETQIDYWKNSETLFRRAIAVTNRNALAQHNLGVALAAEPGHIEEAIEHYRAALAIEPNAARTHTDLGTALSQIPSRLPEAVAEYRTALQLIPDAPIPHNNLANTLSRMPGGWPEAIAEYETALRLAPHYTEARANLANAHAEWGAELARSGRTPEAIRELEAALRLRPDDAATHNNLGVVLTSVHGREKDALDHFAAAVKLDPYYPEARVNLGIGLLQQPGHKQEAIAQLQEALRLKPDPEIQALLQRVK
ncbi:MAG TPA: tetratricopeptide repeat protein [Bryobacteraceae bacterium]